ncbi:MAG: serine/threonine-protein kinase [Candidatus Hydrogenedentes bacterium]|nr:serine/threonine-protein kinase [Candidatus Hydrogenedentota bacterium]
MGTVYLARDVALGRPVALKVLLGSLARNPVMVRGFYREAQAAAPLRHPGIVRVYTAGIEGGTPFIAMEYVPGEPLDRFLRRKGQVSWQAALYVGLQVAEALQCAHDAGIIHRDIKPANILLDRQGRVRLTDFGIARVCTVEQEGGEPKIIGTPQYMSPEQCAGDGVTHSTDLYSLGVTMYQMISGGMPFKADSPQALIRLIASEPAPRLNRILSDVPDDVARLVAHLLEKEPEQRPASAREVCETIERLRLEDGGRSAIPQALAAYVREQAQDSPLRALTPPPSRDRAKPTQTDAPKRSGARRRWLLGATFAALAISCATLASAWFALGRPANTMPAPVLQACTFAEQPDGSVLATLPATAYRAARIGWAGSEHVLLVEAIGQPSTLAHGATGILAIRPGEKECINVASPAGATLAAGAAMAEAAPLALASSVRSANTAPAVVLAQRTAADASTYTGLLFLQRWNEAAPALNPAAALEMALDSGTELATDAPLRIQGVLRPDGGAVCTVVERGDGANQLVEQRVYGTSQSTIIVSSGARIVPDSVQYTPSGDHVVYIRKDQWGKQELWITPANGAKGTLLAVGYFVGETAIHPSGDRIAVTWSASLGQTPELSILSLAGGSTLQELGDATVGHDAWLPDGSGIVVAWRGPNGLRQLCVVDVASRQTRALTALALGVGNATAVSADGAWAAGIAEGRDGVGVVFVDLARTPRDRVALQSAPATNDEGAA